MRKRFYFVSFLILLLLNTVAYGKEAENRGGESQDRGRGSGIEREPGGGVFSTPTDRRNGASEPEDEFEVENEVEIENEFEDEFRERVEFNVDGFEVVGPVMALSGSTITVAGQTIVIDPARVGEFEQRGELSVGSLVKVEGVFSGDNKVAREIIVQEAENQQLKIEINDDSGREDRQDRRQDDSVLGRIISFFRSLFR